MKRKIVFTITNDISYDQRMQRICSSLQKGGYDVLLLGRLRSFSKPLPSFPFSTHRIKCFFDQGKLFYLEFNLRLLFFLLFRKTDIYGAIDLDTIIPHFLVSKLKGKPMVYDAHEYFTEVPEVVNRPKVKKIWTSIESWIVPKLQYAYTVNDSLAKLFKEKYNTPFEIIRNASLLYPTLSKTENKKYLIYIGAVNVGRGLEELIEAMPQIDISLYICGDGDILDELKGKVKEKNLGDKVHFTGYVQPKNLHQLTRNAFIGVCLLRNQGLSYYYSLANKFYDYVHAEIPQITINFPEYKKINEQYKVAELIDLDVEQIIKTTQYLLDNPTYYQTLIENCQKAKKELNWEAEEQKLLSFYQKIS
ncbi:MAG: glycosyltransferase family 4 protein [Cytophagales bacterium]|nr:glycosyltransferase family 4 protein [Cytophagales bacterium]